MHFVAIPLGEACATRRARGSARKRPPVARSQAAAGSQADALDTIAGIAPVSDAAALAEAKRIKGEISDLLEASDLARIHDQLVAILGRVNDCLARLDVALVPDPADRIIAAVCLRYRVTVDEIRGRTRPDRVAFPRQVAMFLLRHWGMPFEAVGHAIGEKTHGTAMHACDAVRTRMECEPHVGKAVRELAAKLGIEISTR